MSAPFEVYNDSGKLQLDCVTNAIYFNRKITMTIPGLRRPDLWGLPIKGTDGTYWTNVAGLPPPSMAKSNFATWEYFTLRLWELGTAVPLFAVRSANPDRFMGIYQFTGRIEIFSSLPSVSAFPENLVIQVGGTYTSGGTKYRKTSGAWVAAGTITPADLRKFWQISVIVSVNAADEALGLNLNSGAYLPDTTAYVYIFSLISNAQKATGAFAGVELYNASGDLVYSSAYPTPNVVFAGNINLTLPAGGASYLNPGVSAGVIPNYSSSKVYAFGYAAPIILPNGLQYRLANKTSGANDSFKGGNLVPAFRINGSSTLEASYIVLDTASAVAAGDNKLYGGTFVYDVTGL